MSNMSEAQAHKEVVAPLLRSDNLFLWFFRAQPHKEEAARPHVNPNGITHLGTCELMVRKTQRHFNLVREETVCVFGF